MAKQCASFSPYVMRSQRKPAEHIDSDFELPKKGGRGKTAKGKGVFTNTSGRHNTSKRQIAPDVIKCNNKKLERLYNDTIHYMPPGLTEKQLASVGLSTRAPDMYELCPPGFTTLEDAANTLDASSKPRGRPRGRPKGSKNKCLSRSEMPTETITTSTPRANTTHRRSAVRSKTAAESIEGKIEKIKEIYPYMKLYSTRGDTNTTAFKDMRPGNVATAGFTYGRSLKPTCTISRPISSDEDHLPALDDVLGRRQQFTGKEVSAGCSPVYPSTRSRATTSKTFEDDSKKRHKASRQRPSYEEQSDVATDDENL